MPPQTPAYKRTCVASYRRSVDMAEITGAEALATLRQATVSRTQNSGGFSTVKFFLAQEIVSALRRDFVEGGQQQDGAPPFSELVKKASVECSGVEARLVALIGEESRGGSLLPRNDLTEADRVFHTPLLCQADIDYLRSTLSQLD